MREREENRRREQAALAAAYRYVEKLVENAAVRSPDLRAPLVTVRSELRMLREKAELRSKCQHPSVAIPNECMTCGDYAE